MGSVAERSKALVLGTSLFGGVGSNPTAANNNFFCTNFIQINRLSYCYMLHFKYVGLLNKRRPILINIGYFLA